MCSVTSTRPRSISLTTVYNSKILSSEILDQSYAGKYLLLYKLWYLVLRDVQVLKVFFPPALYIYAFKYLYVQVHASLTSFSSSLTHYIQSGLHLVLSYLLIIWYPVNHAVVTCRYQKCARNLTVSKVLNANLNSVIYNLCKLVFLFSYAIRNIYFQKGLKMKN